jgi:predicted ATPase
VHEFVGRALELTALDTVVLGGARVVTLTGSAGMGKTRLAQEWARRRGEAFAFVDLSSARTLDEATGTVARALGAGLAGDESTSEALRRIARDLGVSLLVLDNLEQLASCAAELIGPFVEAASIVVLATSRERLRLREERVIDLAPLSVAESVELFEHRARAACFGFALDAKDRDVVETVGRRLEGVPLAIELCAALAGVLSPSQMLPRLTNQLDLLVIGARDVPSRHATLRAALEWSWGLLDPEEQRVLAACSVFRESFSLEAAEAVLDVGPSAIVRLQSLHAKSLVRVVEARRHPGERRFTLLASVRELASEKLGASIAKARATSLHAAFYLGVEPRDALRIDEESTEIHAVVERALAGEIDLENKADHSGARTALAALLLLEPVYIACARGRVDVFAALLDRALDAANGRADALVARALHARAFADLLRGRPECAPRFHRALEAARAAGSPHDEARALNKIAMLYEHANHTDAARATFEQAWEIAATGDLDLVADYEITLAGALTWRGDAVGARDHFARALACFEAQGDRDIACLAAGGLALAELNLKLFDAAEAHTRAALDWMESADHRRIQGYLFGIFGRVLHARGAFDDARAAFDAALTIHRAVGDRWQEGVHLALVGYLELDAGEPSRAREHLTRAVDLLVPAYDAQSHALALAALGAALHLEGRVDEARDRFAAATRGLALIENAGCHLIVALFAAIAAPNDVAAAVIARAQGPSSAGATAPVDGSDLVRLALRILRRRRPGPMRTTPPELASTPVPAACLVIGPDARWLRVDHNAPINLLKSRAVRLLLLRLVRARLAAPGQAVPLEDLFAAGWPGERIARRHAANRVYVALHKVKGLGLRGLLQSRDDGFLIDPSALVLEALEPHAEPQRIAV